MTLSNQPQFCSNAIWNPVAFTFSNLAAPYALFITSDNMIYVTEQLLDQVHVYLESGLDAIPPITTDLSAPGGIYVSPSRGMYVDTGNNQRVDCWTLDGTNNSIVMGTTASCLGLFVGINDVLYCSLAARHRVLQLSLTVTLATPTIVAGTGTVGSTPNKLWFPNGIFVDASLNLYVADCNNDRVQKFSSGNMTAITVAGNVSAGTISLKRPTGVTLDADGYLFIVDSGNHRIVAAGPLGFRCIAGCSASSGGSATQLASPRFMSFDNIGNFYVTDFGNDRIQKFTFITASCGKFFRYSDLKHNPYLSDMRQKPTVTIYSTNLSLRALRRYYKLSFVG